MLQRRRPYACSPSQWCGLVLKVVFPVEGEFLGYGRQERRFSLMVCSLALMWTVWMEISNMFFYDKAEEMDLLLDGISFNFCLASLSKYFSKIPFSVIQLMRFC